MNTINEFIAYYEYVMSGDHSEEGWKTKPTTIVKPEVPSVDWEKESSEILYHSIWLVKEVPVTYLERM